MNPHDPTHGGGVPTGPGDPDDAFAGWLASRASPPVPPELADRIMAEVQTAGPHRARFWDRPWVLAGAWAAASLLLLVRVVALFALFWSG